MLLKYSPASGHCGGEEDQVAGGLTGGDADEEARYQAKAL